MLAIACRCDKCGKGFKIRANCNRRLPTPDELISYAIQEGFVIRPDDGSIFCKDCKSCLTLDRGTLYVEGKAIAEVRNVKLNGG